MAAAASVLAAGWLPLGTMTPWAQLVVFRPQLSVGLLTLAAVTGVALRPLRSLCVALAVLAAASTVTLIGRTTGTLAVAQDSVRVLSSM